MKNLALKIWVLVVVTAMSHSSYAQNSILAGKIVDEYNKPVRGAIIEVTKNGKHIEATSDNDGLYYTPLLSSGSYNVAIYMKGNYYKTKKITIAPPGKTKRYYNFTLTSSNAVVSIDEQDPFMAVAFSKVEAKQNLLDFPVRLKRERNSNEVNFIAENPVMWRTDTAGRKVQMKQ